MLSNMSVIRVTVRDLLHNSRTVLAQVQAGQRIELTRRGRVVAVLTAPEPAELAMDELVETGHLRPGWRDRQARLRQTLLGLPARTEPPGRATSTAALLADRYDEQ